MATSGETAWTLTARDLVTTALEENRIIPLGEQPTADELKACIKRLNAMLKSWLAKGVAMWREEGISILVPANTASVLLPDRVGDVVDARLQVSASYQRPLTLFERSEYLMLPNKAQTGQPSAYSVSRGPEGLRMSLWPVPAADVVVVLDAGRMTETVTDASQTVDIPEMWQETVYSCLAVRCAGLFGAELSQELVARAQSLEAMMLDYDRPESYFLGAADYA